MDVNRPVTCKERVVNVIHTMARRLAPALALGLMVAMSPHSQAHADEIYTLSARGVVDVAPDGTVEALEFETDLGAAGPGYESLIRQWRFNPIMTTEGDRVERTVRVAMRVPLYATRQGDGSFGMSTGHPTFVPLDDPGHAQRVNGVEHFPPPRYPEQSARSGYEAQVLMLVQVAPDGSVLRVGTRSAALLNRPPQGGAGRHIRPFILEAKQAVGRIRFAPSDRELREVLIPIRFSFSRDREEDENAWSRIVFLPRMRDAWVEERIARRESPRIEELDASGQPIDTRVALATQIDDPWL